jgi:hypothetical protein
MRDDDDAARLDADVLDQAAAAALGVDDHGSKACVEAAPQLGLGGGAPREDVVRGDHGSPVEGKQLEIDLGERRPLDVEHVTGNASQAQESDRVLGRLDGEPQRRPAWKEARAGGVEELAATVTVGHRRGAEPEP